MTVASAPACFCLHSRGVSVVIEKVTDGAPLWRYWGPRLAHGAAPPTRWADGRPLPTFHADRHTPLSIAPVHGSGWFGAPCVLAHRDGVSCAQDWTSCNVVADDSANALTITLDDEPSAVRLTLVMTLDAESDMLTVSSTLTNAGDAIVDVQWLAAGTLPLPPQPLAVISWHGRHNGEFIEQKEALGHSIWRRENRRGLTSHESMPSAVVEADGGPTYAAHLAWSGNSIGSIEPCEDGRRAFQMGEWLAPGEVRLAPGESLRSPDWLATVAAHGRNGVMQRFHQHLRALAPWRGTAVPPRPVHVNSWEGFYFDHDEAALMQLADRAAALGIERFVLDDGWFAGRSDDRRALGDWQVDRGKYPRGLAPLAQHVLASGMTFGLWVEPEMVNPDSALYAAHPGWVLAQTDRVPATARHQLVLDISRSEVADYLFAALSDLLTSLPITYLKWDHNRALTHAGDRPRYRRQVLAAYALLARVRAAFPQVEIESCAGGGGRIDAGILPYVHRFWTSDCIDAVSRVAMQRGFLQFFPPELMGAHVGTAPAHSTGRSQSMDFRCAVAFAGHFGIEMDPATLSDADAATLSAWTALYRAWRGLLHGGPVWLGDAPDGLLWQVHGDAREMVLIVIRTVPATLAHAVPVALPMLDAGADYDVRRIDPRARCDAALVCHGGWLTAHGLDLPPMRAETARLYHIVRRG